MPLPAAADDLFRAEVRAFLAQHLSDELRQASRRNAAIFAERDVGQRWMRILAARGWSVPHWPGAWGGTGWTPQQHDIFASELAAADAPVLAPQGPKMVAPVLRPDDTQAAMLHSLQRWLAQQAPFERRAGLLASPSAIEPLWHGLHHDLGLLGAGLPEAMGGLGGGLADQALILQALGQALLPEPYTAVVVLAGGLLRRLPGPESAGLLAGLLDGAARPVLAALEPGARHHLGQVQARLSGAPGALRLSGRKTGVRAAPQATHWLVTARDAAGHLCLALVMPDAPGVQRRDLLLADGSWASELAFDNAPVAALLGEPGADLLPALQQASDDALLATGAEALGVMQRLMRETLDHVRQRRQFGVPLASFQVLQHRLADMHMALIQASALVGATLQRLPGIDDANTRQSAVASAQVAVARACRSVGQGAVQLHGGMGVSDELAVGHAFKRLTLIESQGGGIDGQLRRVAAGASARAGNAAAPSPFRRTACP